METARESEDLDGVAPADDARIRSSVYWHVDPGILWRTVRGDLPRLLKQLDAMGLPEA